MELVATVTTVVVVSGMVDIVVDTASELVVATVLCVVGIVDAVVLRAVVGAVTDVSASPNTLGCSLLQPERGSQAVKKCPKRVASIDSLPHSSTFFRHRYLAGIVVT